MKKDTIDFTSEVVERVYEFLPSEQKYITDEVGNIYKLDPVGVVRTALESMQYQMDPAWYSYGTKASKLVNNIQIAESIKWNDLKDNKQETIIQNRILGLPINAKENQRIQRFNELDVNQWFDNYHKELLQNLKEEIIKTNPQWKDSLKTISIATFITKDGYINHIISVNGKTSSKSGNPYKISDWMKSKFNARKDIIIAFTPEGPRRFPVPALKSGKIDIARDNHAEVKILEELVKHKIAQNSKIFLSSNRRMCVTCRIVKQQFKILKQVDGQYFTIDFYDGKGLEKVDRLRFPKDKWNENEFKKYYYDTFFKDLDIEDSMKEQYLELLWTQYGHNYYVNPISLKLLFS